MTNKIRKAYKYDLMMRARIIEYSLKGYNLQQIYTLLGISRATLSRWIKKYNLKDAIEAAKSEFMKDLVEEVLIDKARGSESSETIEEFMREREDGTLVKTTVKTRKHPKCEKSAQIIAKKYAVEYSEKAEVSQGATNINIQLPNTSGMSKRELQDFTSSSPLGAIDAEYSVVDYGSVIDSGGSEAYDYESGSDSPREES